MYILICDSEMECCQRLKSAIEEFLVKPNIDIELFGENLLNRKDLDQVDVIFLEIELSDLNGMCVARNLRHNGYKGYIIFTANNSNINYLEEAFIVRAFRYFQKPISKLKLEEALETIKKDIIEDEAIAILIDGLEQYISVSEILYIEAGNNDTYIWLKDTSLKVRKKLKYWVEKLSKNGFFQIHRSYLVSLRYVESIENGEVHLTGVPDALPISRHRIAECKNAYASVQKQSTMKLR